MASRDDDPATDVLMAGARIGEYVVGEVLGRGGFGIVYACEQPKGSKRVAIKVLTQARNPELVRQYVEDAQTVNRLGHPGIVPIFEFGETEDGTPYVVMERLAGETLAERLDREGRLTSIATLELLDDVRQALSAAHEAGVVHRDLQPANVFLTSEPEERAIILDFGLAKLLSDDDHRKGSRTGEVLGTPQFMAPEQCQGGDVDLRADVYAFGALAYQMLTGKPPYQGPNAFATLMLHVSAPIPKATAQVEDLPAELDGAFTQLLAKEPKDRPNTIEAAFDRLNAILAPPKPEVASEPAAVDGHRSSTASRRGPVSWKWVAAAGLGLAAAVGLFAFNRAQNRAAENRGRPAPAASAPKAVPTPPPTSADIGEAGAQPSASRHVVVIEGVPEGTNVMGPAGPLGTAPGKIHMEASAEPIELELRHRDYQVETVQVVPDRDQTVRVDLVKKALAKPWSGAEAARPSRDAVSE